MVGIYLTTAIGVPVYMHYCGGELEKVSYLIKSKGCCGSDDEAGMDGCCQDENFVARCAPDFTAKKINSGVDFVLPCFDLVLTDLFYKEFIFEKTSSSLSEFLFPPPKLLQENIVRTSILRI